MCSSKNTAHFAMSLTILFKASGTDFALQPCYIIVIYVSSNFDALRRRFNKERINSPRFKDILQPVLLQASEIRDPVLSRGVIRYA
jgi:hypothetical protein